MTGCFRSLARTGRASWRFLALALILATLAPRPADAAEPFRIGTSATGILIWVAEVYGLFKDAGVEVEVVPTASGVTALDGTQDGSIDLGASSEFAVISRVMESPGICIYATISAGRSRRLLARTDRVGPVAGLLRGKRIGVTFGTVSRFFLWQYLTLSDIPETEVTLIDLSPTELVEAMESGTVDAAMTWEPYVTEIRTRLSGNVVDFVDQMDQHYYFLIQGRCGLEDERPAELRAVLRALVEAEALVRRDSKGVRDAVGRRLGLDPEAIAGIWPLHSLNVVLTQDLLALMEAEARWRLKEGLSSGDVPDVLSLIRPEPLNDVAPHAVQLIW